MGTRGGLLQEPEVERDGGAVEGRIEGQPAKWKVILLFLDDIRSLYFSSYFIKIHMHKVCHMMLWE